MAGGSVPVRRSLPRRSLSNLVLESLGDDAVEWNLSKRVATAIAAAPLIFGGAIGSTKVVHRLYQLLTTEDGIIEWFQFFALVVAVIATALVALELRRTGRLGWAAFYALGALAVFFVAGEEISWGQRIFGWMTPQKFWEMNVQGETNLHNLRPRYFNIAMLGVAGYLTIAPLVVAWARRSSRSLPDTSLIVPPLVVATSFAVTFTYNLYRVLLHGAIGGSFAEVGELALYMGAATYVVLLLRKLRAVDRSVRVR